jgi:hypothetical protein
MLWDPSVETEAPSTAPGRQAWTLNFAGQIAPPKPKTNPTMFPDEFFDSWKPFMLIRHPAITFSSTYRASKEAFGAGINDRWVVQGNSYRKDRIMYDWYRERMAAKGDSRVAGLEGCHWPIVLDMYDIVHSKAVMVKFCVALGLDPDTLRYEWNSAPDEYVRNQALRLRAFLSTMHSSTHVDGEKAPRRVDLDVEYTSWVQRWGESDAQILRGQVEKANEDYEYLWDRRLSV